MLFSKHFVATLGLLALNGVFFQTSPAVAAYSGSLQVEFVGLNSSKGQVCMNLFNGYRGFPNGGSGASIKASRCTPIKGGSARFVFNNLAYGYYAVSSVHDLNGDTRLNSNFLGIPQEGIGFSNNPRIQNSAPSFQEAQFFLSSPKNEIRIQMQYF